MIYAILVCMTMVVDHGALGCYMLGQENGPYMGGAVITFQNPDDCRAKATNEALHNTHMSGFDQTFKCVERPDTRWREVN